LEVLFASSEERFGVSVADRYRRLVSMALRDLRADPARQGVRTLNTESGMIGLYHLRHSRRRIQHAPGIARPRHVLAFRFVDDTIVILRVLHDAMDMPTQLAGL
jgi:toxin ParE1/3/4